MIGKFATSRCLAGKLMVIWRGDLIIGTSTFGLLWFPKFWYTGDDNSVLFQFSSLKE